MISATGPQETGLSLQAQFSQLPERVAHVTFVQYEKLHNDILAFQNKLVPGSNDHYRYSDPIAALLENLVTKKSELKPPSPKPTVISLPEPVITQTIASFLTRSDLYRFLGISKKQQPRLATALRTGFLRNKLPENENLLLPLNLIDFHLQNYNKLTRLEQDPYTEKDPAIFQGILEGDFNQEDLEKAARVGNIRLVQWLVAAERGPKRTMASQQTLQAATKSGNLALLQWLVAEDRGDRRLRADKNTLNIAAALGNLDMVKWLLAVERGDRVIVEEDTLLAPEPSLLADQETLYLATESGNLALLQWLLALEQGDPRLKFDDRPLIANEYTLKAAATSGNLTLVQWLVAEERGDRRLVPDEHTLTGAAKSGNLHLVQWLMAEERGDRRLRANGAALWMAALSGNLALVQWLVANDSSLLNAHDEEMLKKAAYSGNLALVQWLMAEERGDRRLIPTQATLQAAAESNNLALMQWLMAEERGDRRLTANENTLSIAAASGNLDMVQWLAATREGGEEQLEVTFDTLLVAARFGYLKIAQWVHGWLVAPERGDRRLILTAENPYIQEAIWTADTEGHQRVAQWLKSQLAAATPISPVTAAVVIDVSARSGSPVHSPISSPSERSERKGVCTRITRSIGCVMQ